MAQRLMGLRVAAATVILSAGALFSAIPAQAHEMASFGDCGGTSSFQLKYGPVEAISTVNDDVAGIYLYYSPGSACVQGRVEGPQGAEIWLDRCSGSDCAGFLGYNTASSDGLADTGNWNDNGVRSRACGSSGANDHDIVCTDWY